MSNLAILLKESWAYVEDRADDVASYFYARLFLTTPHLRDLFPVELTTLRSRLLDTLASVVQTIDDPEQFDRSLRALGRAHRKFHVAPEYYDLVGRALLDALRAYAGDRWSVEHDQAWRDAYQAMATTMLAGAAEAAHTPPYWHAEVLRHERRTRDVAVFTCLPMTPFHFQAGQYVSLECRRHPRVWRTYSVANAPRVDGTLDFHVRARGGGLVSSALVRRLRAGDMIRLGPPLGSMTLDHESTRDVVCVAGGTGLAPIKALVEQLARDNLGRSVHLLVGAHDRADLYDLPALRQLAHRHPWLSVVTACGVDPTFPGQSGALHTALRRLGPWPEHDIFVSGSPAMVRATLDTLAEMGVPPQRVRYDALSPTVPSPRWRRPHSTYDYLLGIP